MSSDRQILAAMARMTSQEMRYFERVHVFPIHGKRQRCYIALGMHAAYFFTSNMKQYPEIGELPYASITKVVQDRYTKQNVLLVLSDSAAAWKTEKVFVTSENRELFLSHLRCCWTTDSMWRLGRMDVFPLSKYPITKDPDAILADVERNRGNAKSKELLEDPMLEPFDGWKWDAHMFYRFMLPKEFREMHNEIQAAQTGKYQWNVESGKQAEIFKGVQLLVTVHDSMTLSQLAAIHRDNIRWVALDYKMQLTKDVTHFYVWRNNPRLKQMNLVGDPAAWHSWELILRTDSDLLICEIMRRQYFPPICYNAQDIVMMLRVPLREVNGKKVVKKYPVCLQMARVIADSLCPAADRTSVYREMVQAKLDALRYDEEGYEWIETHMKMVPKWRFHAKLFLFRIIQIYRSDAKDQWDGKYLRKRDAIKDGVVASFFEDGEEEELWGEEELMQKAKQDIPALESLGLKEAWAEIFDAVLDYMKKDALKPYLQDEEGSQETKTAAKKENETMQNAWIQRVSIYFAWALDRGGLMTDQVFPGIYQMIESMSVLSESNSKEMKKAIVFLLHLKGENKAFDPTTNLVQKIRDSSFLQTKWTFNDKVMQELINTEYLKKQLGGKESLYLECLAKLLQSSAGVNLKAFICRKFMEMWSGLKAGADEKKSGGDGERDVSAVVIPALVSILQGSNLFLATYASAALVNLSSGNEAAKMTLMGSDIAEIAVKCIKTKDDDLIYYILMILVNLTKEPHNRNVFSTAGLLPVTYDLLTSNTQVLYENRGDADDEEKLAKKKLRSPEDDSDDDDGEAATVDTGQKEKILMQVCTVIGQFCKSNTWQQKFQTSTRSTDGFPYTSMCLTYIFIHFCDDDDGLNQKRVKDPNRTLKLLAQTMFCMKQVCVNSVGMKSKIGGDVIPALICILMQLEVKPDTEIFQNAEFLYQAVLLMHELYKDSAENHKRIDSHKGDVLRILDALKRLKAVNNINGFMQKIDDLIETIETAGQ